MIGRMVFTLLLGAATLAFAANAAEAPDPEGSQETRNDSSADTGSTSNRPLSGAEARRANDKGGVFRPSEDISEDIAVSFPVDI